VYKVSSVIATYVIYDKKGNFEQKAESIAVGLTVGSWTDLAHVEKEQLEKHKGEVVSVIDNGEEHPAFGRKATIEIQYPAINFSTDIPAILTTVFGKLSFDGTIKLIDLQFSDDLLSHFSGPKWGINGIRKELNVFGRPLLMSIFKGVIGRDEAFLKDQLRSQFFGGVDIVKDDEILFENPLTPIEKRVAIGKEVLKELFEETGRKGLYAINLTGRTFELKDKAKRAVELGATALLFNVFTYGLDTLQSLVEDEEINVPIMAHPSFSGAIASSPYFGVSYALLLGKLVRLAGADFSLFPSPYGSVAIPKEDAIAIQAECVKTSVLKRTFPVPSAGIHPGLVPQLIHDFGIDSIINAGGGVHGHPEGAIGGGRAFRQAMEATLKGQSLTEAAREHSSLRQAIERWGVKEVVR